MPPTKREAREEHGAHGESWIIGVSLLFRSCDAPLFLLSVWRVACGWSVVSDARQLASRARGVSNIRVQRETRNPSASARIVQIAASSSLAV